MTASKGAGGHHLAGAKRPASRDERIGKPGQRMEGISGGMPALLVDRDPVGDFQPHRHVGAHAGSPIGHGRAADKTPVPHEIGASQQGDGPGLRGKPAFEDFESGKRAVVFSSLEDLAARIDDPDLDVGPDDVLVLQNAGPKSAAAMPEATPCCAAGTPCPATIHIAVQVMPWPRLSSTMPGSSGQ